jgi:hypothetical protein
VKAITGFLMLLAAFGGCGYKDFSHVQNGSHDGRFHTCGYVTEDGVTDHLADFKRRCG